MKLKRTFIVFLFFLSTGSLWAAEHFEWVSHYLGSQRIKQAEGDLNPDSRKNRHLSLPGGALLGRFSACMIQAIDQRLEKVAQFAYASFANNSRSTTLHEIQNYFADPQRRHMLCTMGFFGNVDAISTGSIVAALSLFRDTEGNMPNTSLIPSVYDADGQRVFSVLGSQPKNKEDRSESLYDALLVRVGCSGIQEALFDVNLRIWAKTLWGDLDEKRSHFVCEKSTPVLDACVASCALPAFFLKHRINSKDCYDLGRFRGNHPVYKIMERIMPDLEPTVNTTRHWVVNFDTGAFALPDVKDSSLDAKMNYFSQAGKLEFINVFVDLSTKDFMTLLPFIPLLNPPLDLAVNVSHLGTIKTMSEALVAQKPDGSFQNTLLERVYNRIEAWMILSLEKAFKAWIDPSGAVLDSALEEAFAGV